LDKLARAHVNIAKTVSDKLVREKGNMAKTVLDKLVREKVNIAGQFGSDCQGAA
jgi:hypothetical protein